MPGMIHPVRTMPSRELPTVPRTDSVNAGRKARPTTSWMLTTSSRDITSSSAATPSHATRSPRGAL